MFNIGVFNGKDDAVERLGIKCTNYNKVGGYKLEYKTLCKVITLFL